MSKTMVNPSVVWRCLNFTALRDGFGVYYVSPAEDYVSCTSWDYIVDSVRSDLCLKNAPPLEADDEQF